MILPSAFGYITESQQHRNPGCQTGRDDAD